MANVLVITEHMKGEFQDISFEMLGQARKLAAGGSCRAVSYTHLTLPTIYSV